MWLRVADPARGDQGTKSWPKYRAQVVFAGLVAWTEKKKTKTELHATEGNQTLACGCFILDFFGLLVASV